MADIWKDPDVKAALKDRRSADDIRVLSCPKCGAWGYYNEGSHFYCKHCKKGWSVTSEMADESITLSDTVTVPTEGYENKTL